MAGRGFDQPAAWILSVMISGLGFTGIYFGLTNVAKKRASHSTDVDPGGHEAAAHPGKSDHGDSGEHENISHAEPSKSGHGEAAHGEAAHGEAAHGEAAPDGHSSAVDKHPPEQNGGSTPADGGHSKAAPPKAQGVHWSYSGDTGESHWADLNPKYKACNTGRQQSPIDVDGAIAGKMLKPIQFNYKLSDVSVRNLGHALQVDFPPGNWIQLNGERYDLLQFHFHIPSEHRVGGAQYEMEVHMVHKNAQDELAVIGIFFRNGAENKVLAPVWATFPKKVGKVEKPIKFNMNSLLPKSRRYVTYSGSLTTPPCSEGVTWVLMDDALNASGEQLDAPMKIHGYNARSPQALYGRPVLRSVK